MKTKHIAIIIIIFSIFFLGFSFTIHSHLDSIYMDQMKEHTGSTCFLDDGSCIHENPLEWLFILSYIIGVLFLIFGIYLSFDKTHIKIVENLNKISGDLRKIKELDDEDRTFEYFLKGFNDEEKEVLRYIRKQEGIWQSTLRIKLSYSKAKLSLVLQDLEEKGYVIRKKKGKTYELYIKGLD